MNDFDKTLRPLDDSQLEAVTGGLPWNYDWAHYDWRDAVIEALP
ncbi:hypothetical protein [Microbispora sp. NPDC046933]